MGKRGPKRTATATLEQRGSWRAADRKSAEPAAEQLGQVPDPPRSLPLAAKVYWQSLARSLWASGRLTADDMPAFGRYCRVMARFDDAERGCDVGNRTDVMSLRDLHTVLKEYDARFGLTPADRAEMAVSSKPQDGRKKLGSGGLSAVA